VLDLQLDQLLAAPKNRALVVDYFRAPKKAFPVGRLCYLLPNKDSSTSQQKINNGPTTRNQRPSKEIGGETAFPL
jgi:hypothetical protein